MEPPIVHRQRVPRTVVFTLGFVLTWTVVEMLDIQLWAWAPFVSYATAMLLGLALDVRAARRGFNRRVE